MDKRGKRMIRAEFKDKTCMNWRRVRIGYTEISGNP